MEAYIDDSMTDGQVLVFGGLIASAERWAEFSIDWQRCLDLAPWDVFKMSKVWHRCVGEKRRHAQRHYCAVRKHVQGGICFVIPLAALEKAAARYGLTETPAAKPYIWAPKGIISGLAQNQRRWGLTCPVNFIFDERPKEERDTLRDAWQTYLTTVPEEVRSVTGRRPVFADDREVLPLQAADMWAWACRRTWLDNGGMIPEGSYPVQWGELGDIPQVIVQWTAQDIETELSKIASLLKSPIFLTESASAAPAKA